MVSASLSSVTARRTEEGGSAAEVWRAGSIEAAEHAEDLRAARAAAACSSSSQGLHEHPQLARASTGTRERDAEAGSGCKRYAVAPGRAVTRWLPGSIEAAEEELDRQLAARAAASGSQV